MIFVGSQSTRGRNEVIEPGMDFGDQVIGASAVEGEVEGGALDGHLIDELDEPVNRVHDREAMRGSVSEHGNEEGFGGFRDDWAA